MYNVDVDALLNECSTDLSNASAILSTIGTTSNIVPYLNKYCIIRACGSIEVSFKTIIADFIDKRSKKQIKNYINERIRENSANPSYQNICKLLKSFDTTWNNDFKRKLKSHVDHSSIMSSIGSLVDARNEFAHGGNPTITLRDTIRYYEEAKKLISILDEVVR